MLTHCEFLTTETINSPTDVGVKCRPKNLRFLPVFSYVAIFNFHYPRADSLRKCFLSSRVHSTPIWCQVLSYTCLRTGINGVTNRELFSNRFSPSCHVHLRHSKFHTIRLNLGFYKWNVATTFITVKCQKKKQTKRKYPQSKVGFVLLLTSQITK